MTAAGAPTPHVTVLGATGFIGSAVLRELAARPIRIRAVSRRPGPVPPAGPAEVEVRTLDLTAPGAVREATEGTDLVVHAVAHIAGVSTWRVDTGDTGAERVTVGVARDLVDTAATRGGGPLPVVFTGTTTQAGLTRHEVLDGSEPDRPAGEYDRQKLAAERLLLAATERGVLAATSLRLPTVFGYGPHSTAPDKGVVADTVRRALAGQPLTMWHDGSVRRDFLYVDDAARALTAACDHIDELSGRGWLVGTGVGTPLAEAFAAIANIAAEHTGTRVPVVSVEPPEYAEPGDFRSVTVDSTAFRTVTGWRPRVDLTAALRHTIAHCQGQLAGRGGGRTDER
ncbi:NAD-dependent epimerase/dehydratase family protein [Micromonospora andamanensis]|uniref:NAD-dependent epimerase/dehydratase family protein n=1 Tax=Micromonospora andamanensis TaxID=1287068 RepID=UPI0019523878|nr:NAD-dependent epimerase/dehydratase [Micromonospora andamanensis]GIJ42507.1 NAD-dependent dehydratase [Micromonospora andamanensis]